MAEFYVSVSTQDMATQIADLINRYNQWYTTYTPMAISIMPANYFVTLDIDRVIGCSANIKEYPTLSKIMHVCVVPEFRNKGIAKSLVELSIQNCDTDYVYMTIRKDNIPSLRMANSLGFKFIKQDWFKDHWTLTLGRTRIV